MEGEEGGVCVCGEEGGEGGGEGEERGRGNITSISFTHTQLTLTYHFNDVHLSGDPELVEEHGKVLLHLDAVVLHLCRLCQGLLHHIPQGIQLVSYITHLCQLHQLIFLMQAKQPDTTIT